MSLNLVHQETNTGCGIASLAMISGKSYHEMVKFLKKDKDSDHSTTIISLAKALQKLKIRFEVTLFNGYGLLDCDCLILKHITDDEKADYQGHVVVWDSKRKKILDPANPKPVSYKKYNKDITFVVKILGKNNER